jgi:hypothetical protein
MTIRIKQGTSTKKLVVHGSLTSAFATYDYDMTRAEIRSFTNWNDLRIEADFSTGGDGVSGGTISPEVAYYEVIFT